MARSQGRMATRPRHSSLPSPKLRQSHPRPGLAPMRMPTRRFCVPMSGRGAVLASQAAKDLSLRLQPRAGTGMGREWRAAVCGMAAEPSGGCGRKGRGHCLCQAAGLEGDGGAVHVAVTVCGAAAQPDQTLPELGGQGGTAADQRADASPCSCTNVTRRRRSSKR